MLSELHTERSMARVEAAVNKYRQWFQRETVQRFRSMIDPGPLMDDIVEITMDVDESDSEQSSDHDEHEEDSNGNANDIEVKFMRTFLI